MKGIAMYLIRKFVIQDLKNVLDFLRQCLPESERKLELEGRHKIYLDIEHYFESFWIMLDGEEIIGTAALRRMDGQHCELKCLYLYKSYQGRDLEEAFWKP